MAFGAGRQRRDRLSEINVTPFVDVVLVLLVIFMITAPMLQTGLQVKLPKATLAPLPTDTRPRVLTLTRDGSIYLGDTRFRAGEVTTKLLPLLRKHPEKTLYLRADRALPYGAVARFIGQLYEAGIRKVSLVTEPKQKAKKTKR